MGIYFELLSSKMSIKFLDDATSCQILFVTEKERERERIQTDRQTDRQTDKKIERSDHVSLTSPKLDKMKCNLVCSLMKKNASLKIASS